MYYGLRGISLIYLPYTDFSLYSLSIFAVFYGLDWIATVPPTVKLAVEAFGDRDGPIVFGWIAAGHQLGAASSASFAGYVRTEQGRYFAALIIARITCVVSAVPTPLTRCRTGSTRTEERRVGEECDRQGN